MCHSERCLQPIILNYRAASVGVAHRADICHSKSVTRMGTTQVLEGQKEDDYYRVLLFFLFIKP